MARILIGFVQFSDRRCMSIFRHPAASPPVIPGAIIVLAMTLGYSSMNRVVSRRQHAATTKSLSGGPTGLPLAMRKNVPSNENLP